MEHIITTSLLHTIPTTIFQQPSFPHIQTLTNHILHTLSQHNLQQLKQKDQKIKSTPLEKLTEEELISPNIIIFIKRTLEEHIPDQIYNHPHFPGLFYISSHLQNQIFSNI